MVVGLHQAFVAGKSGIVFLISGILSKMSDFKQLSQSIPVWVPEEKICMKLLVGVLCT